MKVFEVKDVEETFCLANKVAKYLRAGDIIAMRGEMGSGKTTFVRGLAAALKVKGEVSSPTFSIMQVYDGDLPVHHYDMYRVDTEDSLESIGFFDDLDGSSLLVIEWSENIDKWLPKGCIYITLEKTGETGRKITIEGERNFEDFSD